MGIKSGWGGEKGWTERLRDRRRDGKGGWSDRGRGRKGRWGDGRVERMDGVTEFGYG